jgi:signal transduction histidine kinase
MPIDFQRLVDGLSVVAEQVGEGQAGLGVLDGLLVTICGATGAVAATCAEFADDGTGRIVAACGAMTFAAGQPVPPELIDMAWTGMWAGATYGLPGRSGHALRSRGIEATVGCPWRIGGRTVGCVNLYFPDVDPSAWAALEPAMRVVAAMMSRAHAIDLPARTSAPDEDDRALFLAVTGHELRTPVTVVKGYANMLADRWDSLDESHRRAGVKVMAQRADEMARLVDRMLGASVGDAPPGRLVRAVRFDLAEALRKAVADLPADLRGAVRLDLPTESVGGLPAVSGDPAMLGPVVSELVINAMRHTPGSTAAAGPLGTGDAPLPVVEIQAGADAQTVAIRVCDRGVGIDPAHVERAFDRFWRDSRDADQRGVGLGLYLVRRLVERQHGWVSLRPRDGGGTVAEIRLRRADAVPPAAGSATGVGHAAAAADRVGLRLIAREQAP